MLPMPITSSSYSTTPNVSEYVWRVFNISQMDFQFAYSQMVDLLRTPSEVYKTTSIRKQIKNQWSRDDPAFVVLQMLLMLFACLSWLIGFGAQSLFHAVSIVIGGIFIQFLLVGAVIATAVRWYANRAMRVVRLHAIDQQIEWLYSFDIHCNSFFSVFLLLFCLQYFLLPLILSDSWFGCLLGNSLYLAALISYCYGTFLGYAALPFIDKPQRLLYPLVIAIPFYLLCSLLRINLAWYLLTIYFGHSEDTGTIDNLSSSGMWGHS